MRNRFTTRNQWFTETIETIRTSGLTLIISTMRLFKTFTPELHLTKLQQVEYQHNGNRLFPNYFECTRQKVSFIFLKNNILPLSGIRVEKDFKFDRVFGRI